MKKLIALIFTVLCINIHAQELKFAHVDSQMLFAQLPEKAQADSILQGEAKVLEDQLMVMRTDLEAKYNEYVEQRETMPELIRATKEKEIQDANQRLQSYQQLAQQTLAQKEQELLMPILEKYQKAIDAVGEEMGFVYIFDLSSQVVLFHSDKSVDVTPMVKAKLQQGGDL